jgi:hypothetical protein
MSQHLPESDWKLFRKIRVLALDRFCERTLAEIVTAASSDPRSAHDRYVAIYELLQTRDKELARAFDDLKRSQAITHLAVMWSLKLLTEAELQQFSAETQTAVGYITGEAIKRGASA